MTVGNMQYLELKYCERCGTLGLRRKADGIYCGVCAGEMNEAYLARSGGEKKPGAPDGAGLVMRASAGRGR